MFAASSATGIPGSGSATADTADTVDDAAGGSDAGAAAPDVATGDAGLMPAGLVLAGLALADAAGDGTPPVVEAAGVPSRGVTPSWPPAVHADNPSAVTTAPTTINRARTDVTRALPNTPNLNSSGPTS
jgi:hypothetical protein